MVKLDHHPWLDFPSWCSQVPSRITRTWASQSTGLRQWSRSTTSQEYSDLEHRPAGPLALQEDHLPSIPIDRLSVKALVESGMKNAIRNVPGPKLVFPIWKKKYPRPIPSFFSYESTQLARVGKKGAATHLVQGSISWVTITEVRHQVTRGTAFALMICFQSFEPDIAFP